MANINEGLYTERLILKILDESAAGDVVDFYVENPEFEKYEPKRVFNFYTNNYMASTMKYEREVIEKKLGLRFWIFEKESPYKIIGTVSFQNVMRNVYKSCQLGYKIHKAYQQKGYATEAVGFACRVAFRELDVHRIEAYTMPENIPSARLLEKLGFSYEGIARQKAEVNGKWADHMIFSLLESEV
ncbi:MAG: GNAT family N-acetyltransferase [Lachnospiraceae bacterium]|nr:GNAT family N-acetyltransferase [Lachnospiraceae bacterium]